MVIEGWNIKHNCMKFHDWYCLVFIIVFFACIFHCNSKDKTATNTLQKQSSNYHHSNYYTNNGTISRDEAIDDYWDEIKEYLNGTEDIEATSDSGTYTLEAEFSNGYIEKVNFPNGGYLAPDEEIDNWGEASYNSDDGSSWDFTLDMNSIIVDNAIDEWANNNGYIIE